MTIELEEAITAAVERVLLSAAIDTTDVDANIKASVERATIVKEAVTGLEVFARQDTANTFAADQTLTSGIKQTYLGVTSSLGFDVYENGSGELIFENKNASGKDIVFDTTGIKYNNVYLTTIDTFLPLSGGTMTGDLDMTDEKILLGSGIASWDISENSSTNEMIFTSGNGGGVKADTDCEVLKLTSSDITYKSTNRLVGSDTSADTGSDQVYNIVSLTQAEYDALTPVSTTLYVIV